MKGKVALITGGAKGIGRAFAEKLLSHGAKVLLVDVNEVVGKATEDELIKQYGPGSSKFYKCDVTSKADMADAFKVVVKTFGKLDILCNNAGICDEVGPSPVGPEQMIAINLTSVIHWTMMGIQYMSPPAGHGGVIINTASAVGFVADFSTPVYVATKHGVVGFTRGIGLESQQRYNIRVNCICPTYIDTDIYTQIKGNEEHKAKSEAIGVMQPQEVAEAFYELLQIKSLSGGAMVVSPQVNKIVNLPTALQEVLAASDGLAPRV